MVLQKVAIGVRLAINAEAVYKLFRIETDKTGKFWVADLRGENVVTSERFDSHAEAQDEWSRRVEAVLK